MFSCTSRKIIPEITPDITAFRMKNISISKDIFAVLPGKDSLILPDLKGNISAVTDEKKNPEILAEYKKGLRGKFIINGNILVLFLAKKRGFIIFDLEKKKPVYESNKNLNIRSIGKSIFLQTNEKKIEIIDFKKENTLYSKIIDHGKLIDSDLSEDMAILLFEKSLLIYNTKSNTDAVKVIDVRPVSPFLRLKDNIYFGDESRTLVKFSLKKRRIIWRYKFQKLLRIEPLSYKGMIIASPGDNNTYLITQRGGVKDWYRSESGRLYDPVLMKDHLAVVLRIEDGTSINYYGLKDHSISNFKDKFLTLKFPPVYFKNHLYSAGVEGDDPQLKLIKIGNRFGSFIKLEPEKELDAGKSIRFIIKTVNMYKPDITTVLYNEKEEIVFSKHTPFTANPSFAWVPESGGNFTLKVTTKEKDGNETTDIKNLTITDSALMYKNLQIKLHRNCRGPGIVPEKKNEEKDL